MSLKELLGEELHSQVKEKLGDKELIVNDGSYVPRERLNEVTTQRDDYKKMLDERNTQLEELKKKAKGSEELTAQLEELKKKNEETQQEYEQRLQKQKFDFALDRAIDAVKGPEVKTRAVRALLDEEKITLDDGKLLGLDAQIEELQKSDPYLFETKKFGKGGTDFGGNNTVDKNPFSSEHFNLTEQGQIMRKDPELAKRLMAEAKQKK